MPFVFNFGPHSEFLGSLTALFMVKTQSIRTEAHIYEIAEIYEIDLRDLTHRGFKSRIQTEVT